MAVWRREEEEKVRRVRGVAIFENGPIRVGRVGMGKRERQTMGRGA